MTLLDAGREFARLTSGLASPKQHVELMQCVLNNTLDRLHPKAISVFQSIPEDKRANIPEATMHRLIELLQFFEQMADVAKTGKTPAMSTDRQKENTMATDTKDYTTNIPLLLAHDT